MANKYVYIIMTGCEGDEHPYEVYSNSRKAKNKLMEMEKDPYWRTTNPYIDKWEIK